MLAPSVEYVGNGLIAQRGRTTPDIGRVGRQSAARNEGSGHGQRIGTNGKYRIGVAGSRLTRIVRAEPKPNINHPTRPAVIAPASVTRIEAVEEARLAGVIS
jgi:hypothetical protein